MLAASSPTWTDMVQAISAAVGLVGIIAALLYSARQVRLQTDEQQRTVNAQHANLDLGLMQSMLELDTLFINKPHLYQYFNDNTAEMPATDHPHHPEVVYCAELILDFADMVSRQIRYKQMQDEDITNWQRFFTSYYVESPSIRVEYPRF